MYIFRQEKKRDFFLQ